MTAAELTAARVALGFKRAADLGRALELEGRDPGRDIRAWETGARTIPGPVRVALRLMLANHARQGLQDAILAARDTLGPLTPPPAILEALESLDAIHQAAADNGFQIKTRRRG